MFAMYITDASNSFILIVYNIYIQLTKRLQDVKNYSNHDDFTQGIVISTQTSPVSQSLSKEINLLFHRAGSMTDDRGFKKQVM